MNRRIERERKLTCSFMLLSEYDTSHPMMNRYEQQMCFSRTESTSYQPCSLHICLPGMYIHTKLGVYMHILDSTQRTIAYTGTYQRIAEEALRACRRWEQYITLAHVCLHSSLTLSPSFNVLHIRPLSLVLFDSPYARPLFYTLIIFTHFLQPA